MKRLAESSSASVRPLALAACATGPRFDEVQQTIPGIAPDRGRIYFYRSGTLLGAGVQPDVELNGSVVGRSKPGGFFYVDVPPANYEVALSSGTGEKAIFALEQGQERCVRMSPSPGVLSPRVVPELVEPAACRHELANTSYIGSIA